MFKRSNLRYGFWLLLASVSAGCASPSADEEVPVYDRPYALIEPGTASTVRRESPVLVHEVDGEIPVSSLSRRYGIPVEPGRHKVVVHFASGTGEGNAEKYQRTIDLDAAPCTRYRIVAHHTGTAHVDWDPVVYPEPIGECIKRFPKPSP
jgi:hypothetical protein